MARRLPPLNALRAFEASARLGSFVAAAAELRVSAAAVSQQVRRTLRTSDQLFRFGGEEFVVMLHGVEEPAARAVFDRLRLAVERHEFPQLGAVTISLGWTFVAPHDGPMSCLERADAALYFAKAQGRNRAFSHEELVAGGRLGPQAAAREIELF